MNKRSPISLVKDSISSTLVFFGLGISEEVILICSASSTTLAWTWAEKNGWAAIGATWGCDREVSFLELVGRVFLAWSDTGAKTTCSVSFFAGTAALGLWGLGFELWTCVVIIWGLEGALDGAALGLPCKHSLWLCALRPWGPPDVVDTDNETVISGATSATCLIGEEVSVWIVFCGMLMGAGGFWGEGRTDWGELLDVSEGGGVGLEVAGFLEEAIIEAGGVSKASGVGGAAGPLGCHAGMISGARSFLRGVCMVLRGSLGLGSGRQGIGGSSLGGSGNLGHLVL